MCNFLAFYFSGQSIVSIIAAVFVIWILLKGLGFGGGTIGGGNSSGTTSTQTGAV